MNAKLKIKQCPDPLMWYADKIGQEVTYCGEAEEYYWSREDAGYKNIVLKEDAEIIPKVELI